MIEIILRYPEKQEHKDLVKKNVSFIKAMLILKGIDDLKIDEVEKEKLLFSVIEKLEKRARIYHSGA